MLQYNNYYYMRTPILIEIVLISVFFLYHTICYLAKFVTTDNFLTLKSLVLL